VLCRFEDWPSRLSSYLEERRSVPFCYGTHDCCLFVGDAIVAMTGTDIAAQFRNSYRSSLGALRRIRSYLSRRAALEGIAEAVFAAHTVPEIPARHAARGDVLLLALPSGDTLGLVSLSGCVIAAAECGWLSFPLTCARRAWRI
jgi:hypothetical protein